jgi:CDI toxin RNase A-like protein
VAFVFHSDRPSLVKARSGFVTIALAIALVGCRSPVPGQQSPVESRQDQPRESQPAAPNLDQRHEAAASRRAAGAHDLSVDEASGGHTLERHIGKTDAELRDRLRREPAISSASTYTDRETAERVVGAALASGGASFEKWKARQGRRPNYVLRYNAHEVIGRSVQRDGTSSVPCERALVVLRWDDRAHQFYVLTSYPEEHR